MKSGLEGRNNPPMQPRQRRTHTQRLNEVRPGRPEQSARRVLAAIRLRTVSMKSGLEGRNNQGASLYRDHVDRVSMKSGLEGRNNGSPRKAALTRDFTSTCELSASPGPIKPLC